MTLRDESVSPKGEGWVVVLDAMYAIATHAADVDCDGECAAWMHERAIEALRIFFKTEDWTWGDVERVRAEVRRVA